MRQFETILSINKTMEKMGREYALFVVRQVWHCFKIQERYFEYDAKTKKRAVWIPAPDEICPYSRGDYVRHGRVFHEPAGK